MLSRSQRAMKMVSSPSTEYRAAFARGRPLQSVPGLAESFGWLWKGSNMNPPEKHHVPHLRKNALPRNGLLSDAMSASSVTKGVALSGTTDKGRRYFGRSLLPDCHLLMVLPSRRHHVGDATRLPSRRFVKRMRSTNQSGTRTTLLLANISCSWASIFFS